MSCIWFQDDPSAFVKLPSAAFVDWRIGNSIQIALLCFAFGFGCSSFDGCRVIPAYRCTSQYTCAISLLVLVKFWKSFPVASEQ
jgi:hypothetical protein